MARVNAPWAGSAEPPYAVTKDPMPPSTYGAMGAWNQGDALDKYYRDAAAVRNFSRRGAWGVLAPRPVRGSASRPGPSVNEHQAAVKPINEQPLQANMPGGTGAARCEYMKSELVPGRLFNVASRGLPSGAQPKWSFDRMPSLLPPPLMRDFGVARSCAGVAPRVGTPLTRMTSNPELGSNKLPPLTSQRNSMPNLK